MLRFKSILHNNLPYFINQNGGIMAHLHTITKTDCGTKRFSYLSKQHKRNVATRDEEVEYYTWVLGNHVLADLVVGLKRQEVPHDHEIIEEIAAK